MKLSSLFKLIQVLKYVKLNPDCVTPEIREYLQIAPSDPPTQEEKDLYKIISALQREGYLEKHSIKQRKLGGPHFSLKMTEAGEAFLDSLGLSGEEVVQDRLFDQIGASLRLVIREKLHGKVSKPEMIDLVPELNAAIVKSLKENYFLKKK